MSNILKRQKLFGQQALLVIPLSVILLAFGCTTDRTLGNGNLNDYSGVRMAPTSGVTTGSQTAPALPPPMTSSYSRPEVLPTVSRTMTKLTPDEAALIMVDHRAKVRVLGPVSPALAGNTSLVSGQLQTASLVTGSEPYGGTTIPASSVRNIAPTATTVNTITPTSTASTTTPPPPTVTTPVSASGVRIVTTANGVTVTNQ